MLETGYEATHSTGMRRAELLGRNMGVFVGIMNTDFVALGGSSSVYAATSTQISIAAGRLAFALGTQGPCVSIDTACSSALVALESALLCLHAGANVAALASAVKLVLLPRISQLFAGAGMLSPDGRCKTFDARANGYVRSEGVGTAMLTRFEEVASITDILSSAVRSDGKRRNEFKASRKLDKNIALA